MLRLRCMVHLSKLAVGIRDVAHLRDVQGQRAAMEGSIRHRTRTAPKRAAEVLDGGSIYWVIGGLMQVRQLISDLRPDHRDDGRACTSIVLSHELTPVLPRAVRAFQGWRYLEEADIPLDLSGALTAEGEEQLPERLRQELRLLALL